MFVRSRILGFAVLALALAGCGDEEAVTNEPDCAQLVRDASFAAEVDDQIRQLDSALIGCTSRDEMLGEMALYPGIVGYSNTAFIERRCTSVDADESVTSSAVCRSVATPATTAVAETAPLEYVADTYDGERITVTDAEVEFVNGVPVEIQETVDLSAQGCAVVLGRRDDWLATDNSGRQRQITSMYALHAERVATFIGCDLAAPSTTSVPG